MRTPNSREMALLAVLGGALGIYLWSLSGDDGKAAAAGGPGAVGETGIPGADLAVLIDPDAELPALRKNLRNLFNYARSPEDLARERAEKERLERLRREAEERRRAEQERLRAEAAARATAAGPRPPQKPQPPPINLTFIGYMGEPTDVKRRLVVFSTGGGAEADVFVAARGEVVADKFKVVDIDFESVTLGYVNPEWKDRTRTLRMGG